MYQPYLHGIKISNRSTNGGTQASEFQTQRMVNHARVRLGAISGPCIVHHGQNTQNLNYFTLQGHGYHLYSMFRALRIIHTCVLTMAHLLDTILVPWKPSNLQSMSATVPLHAGRPAKSAAIETSAKAGHWRGICVSVVFQNCRKDGEI